MSGKMVGVKRRHSDPLRTIHPVLDSCERGTAIPCNKKIRRRRSWIPRSGMPRVRWSIPESEISPTEHHDSNEENQSKSENPKERNPTWYSKEEYKQILLDQCLTVQIMRSLRIIAQKAGTKIDEDDGSDGKDKSLRDLVQKMAIDPAEYCERGLESYSTEECRNRINLNRKRHKLLVIQEHTRQEKSGKTNPELIRMLSLVQSNKSTKKAQLLAAIDQREARLVGKNHPKRGPYAFQHSVQNTTTHNNEVCEAQSKDLNVCKTNRFDSFSCSIQHSAKNELEKQNLNHQIPHQNRIVLASVNTTPGVFDQVFALQQQLLLRNLQDRQQQLRQQEYYRENIHQLLLQHHHQCLQSIKLAHSTG